MKRHLRLSILVLVPATALYACGDDDDMMPVPDGGMMTMDGGTRDAGSDGGVATDGGIWFPCGESFDLGADLECAQIEVPLDYAAPEDGTTHVAVMRRNADDPSLREGIWMFHPGSAAGTDMAVNVVLPILDVAGPSVVERFDIIAFNSRGYVGERFTEVQGDEYNCVDQAGLEALFALDHTPDTDAEWMALEAGYQAFVEGCMTLSGTLMPHITSTNVAQDMDFIRELHGDEFTNLSGFSYGSLTQMLYVSQFPERIRATSADSVLPRPETTDMVQLAEGQGGRLVETLQRFFDWCGCDATCAFHGGEGTPAVITAFDAITAGLDATPLEGAAGRLLNEYMFYHGLTQAFFFGDWAPVAEAIAAVEAGDPALAFAYFDRTGGEVRGNTYETWTTLATNDFGCPAGFDLAALRTRAAAVSRVGRQRFIQRAAPCLFWPAPDHPPAPVTATTAPPVLFLSPQRDPIMRAEWPEELRTTLDNGSFIVPFLGEGHTAAQNSNCALAVTLQWIVDPTMPLLTSCAANPGDFTFEGCP